MRAASWLLIPVMLFVLPGCGSSAGTVTSNAGNALIPALAIGSVVQRYIGTTAAGEPAQIDADAQGNCRLTFSKNVVPAIGTAYVVSDTFLWAGLNGTGIFYLTTQSISFPDPVDPAVTDRDDCSGTMNILTNGTFTLTLTVTGFRTPAGAAAPAATTTTGVYSGTYTNVING